MCLLSPSHRDDYNCLHQTMTHHLVSRPWMVGGLSASALVLFLGACVPANESEGSSAGALLSVSACVGVVVSES